MNLSGWHRLLQRRKEESPSPFKSIVIKLRAVRELCERGTPFYAHGARQRASRIATARKRVVYRPLDYERLSWPEASPARFPARWLVFLMAAATAFFMLTSIVCSGGLPWFRGSAHRQCVTTLKALEGSIALWARQNGKTTNDTPTDEDLFGPTRYMPIRLTCPAGGSYIIGKVGEPPRCTIPEHRNER